MPAILFSLVIILFGSSVTFANEGTPKLGKFVGLSVAVPGMNKWQGVPKPGAAAVQEWRRLFGGKAKAQQIEEVNSWVNSQIEYREDNGDQWTSPVQSLSRGFGDCDDYAISKYYILKALNFSEDELFFIVAKDLVVRNDHAVLLVNSEGQEYVLDNFTDRIISPETAVKVIFPEFAFSGQKSWLFGIKKTP